MEKLTLISQVLIGVMDFMRMGSIVPLMYASTLTWIYNMHNYYTRPRRAAPFYVGWSGSGGGGGSNASNAPFTDSDDFKIYNT